MGETYEWSRHRNCPSHVPRLHDRRIHTRNGIRKSAKVTSYQPMRREITVQNIEKLHQASWNVFWQSVGVLERQ